MTTRRIHVLIGAVMVILTVLGCSSASKTASLLGGLSALDRSGTPADALVGDSLANESLANDSFARATNRLVDDDSELKLASAETLDAIASPKDSGVAQASHVHMDVSGNVATQPFSLRGASSPDWTPPASWDMTIDEAIQMALANSTVLRDLGAQVLQSPGTTPTIYSPAIQSTNGTSGVEAALSAFDAQLAGDFFYEDN